MRPMTDLYRDLTPEKYKSVLIFNATGKRGNKYTPHQGEKEKARRKKQMDARCVNETFPKGH